MFRLTSGIISDVDEAIRSGVTRMRALKKAGVSATAYKQIQEMAVQGIEPYAAFVRGLDEAEAGAEATFVATIAESKDWRAAAFLLERRFPEEWGQKIQVEVEEQLKEIFRLAEAILPESYYTKLLETVAGTATGGPGSQAAPAEEPPAGNRLN
ncbi:MAG: hypothetical protein KKF48_05755 [Nanoarchaeota archaeon]|nr:hypothetical protein [Nanoarchaeota archaeon]